MSRQRKKKVGQLTMQSDWLKKSEEICGSDYESKFSPKLLTTKELPVSVVPMMECLQSFCMKSIRHSAE